MGLRATRYPFVILAGDCSIGIWALRAARWKYLLRPLKDLPLHVLLPATFISFLGNYLLPARAGELLRVYIIGQKYSVSKSAILATILLERAMDVSILTGLVALVLGLGSASIQVVYMTELGGFALAILLSLLCLLLFSGRPLVVRIASTIGPLSPSLARRVQSTLQHFILGLEVLRQGKIGFLALSSSLLIWGCTWVIFNLLIWALGLELPWTASLALMATTNLANLIPSLPGRLGVLEFAAIATLTTFGVDSRFAVIFPILLRLSHLLPLAVGYLIAVREGIDISSNLAKA